MSTSILDLVLQTDTTSRNECLARYRRLLTVTDPTKSDADELLDVANSLSFELSRFPDDAIAAREAKRLAIVAAEQPDGETEYHLAASAASEHRQTMAVRIAKLEGKQAVLDRKASSAGGKARRAEHAARRLVELRSSNEDLFADELDDEMAAEQARLQTLADTTPGLREQLAEAEAELENAITAFEKTAADAYHTSPQAIDKLEKIQAKTDAAKRRSSIASRISSLHQQVDKAETAKHQLATL